MSRVFTYSELWGPFSCEHAGCGEDAWAVLLTDEQNARLPAQRGDIAAAFILDNRIGIALCEDHLEEAQA